MYYALSFTGEDPAPRTGRRKSVDYTHHWWNGQRFPKGFTPKTTIYRLEPEYFPPEDEPEKIESIHSYISGEPPIFRDDLIACMQSFGVDNLDCYPCEVHDPDNGAIHTNFKAVNIIGLLSAVDWKKSIATIHPGGPIVDVTFDRLVIDDTKAGKALIFRLRENTGELWVHHSLKEHLEQTKSFPSLVFIEPEHVGFL